MIRRSADAIREIKSRLSLVELAGRYVELRRNGTRWVAPCPFHQETKPSFSINEEEGFFYCFGCQASGDLFDFYGRINGLDFRESLEQLAEETGVALDMQQSFGETQKTSNRSRLLRIQELAAAHFASCLSEKTEGAECRHYIAERGLSDEIIRFFHLGWSPRTWQSLTESLRRAGFQDDLGIEAGVLSRNKESGRVYDRFRGRLMFPIRNLSGSVIAFGGRIIRNEDDAKYVNTGDTPLYKKGDNLYGLQQARQSIGRRNSVMLTEGYMDVLTLHQFGYTQAVGVLGTAFTPEQVKRISGFTSQAELLFDGDGAGRKAAYRACEMLLSRGLNCKVILFPEGEDIDSLLRKSGTQTFEKLRSQATDGLTFCIRTLQNMAPRDAVDRVHAFLDQVAIPELTSRFATRFSQELGLSEADLRRGLHSGSEEPEPLSRQTSAAATRSGFDREILMFAVRYPDALPRLQDIGARTCLVSSEARDFWDHLALASKSDLPDCLSEQEKAFWFRCRTGNVPPLTNEDGEFQAVSSLLQKRDIDQQTASISRALRSGGGSFSSDLEYLKALRDALAQRKTDSSAQTPSASNNEN
ncbi:MAG: DNA primase [Desulfovibrionaceae bacterium]|nr:DNA primase [Desulfovibrionaceae bacterium]